MWIDKTKCLARKYWKPFLSLRFLVFLSFCSHSVYYCYSCYCYIVDFVMCVPTRNGQVKWVYDALHNIYYEESNRPGNINNKQREKGGQFSYTRCTYIRHNYRFRSKCNGFSYFSSNFLCMSDKCHYLNKLHIQLDMPCTLVAFYHHKNHPDNYSSICLRTKSVQHDMWYTAIRLNRCTLNRKDGKPHNCTTCVYVCVCPQHQDQDGPSGRAWEWT